MPASGEMRISELPIGDINKLNSLADFAADIGGQNSAPITYKYNYTAISNALSSIGPLANYLNQIKTAARIFVGYAGDADPASIIAPSAIPQDALWRPFGDTLPDVFPWIGLKCWNGSSWENYTTGYNPTLWDTWHHIGTDTNYFWNGQTWQVDDVSGDGINIAVDPAGKLYLIDASITSGKLAATIQDAIAGAVQRTGDEMSGALTVLPASEENEPVQKAQSEQKYIGQVKFSGTKAAIVSSGAASGDKAVALDTNELGVFQSSAWTWAAIGSRLKGTFFKSDNHLSGGTAKEAFGFWNGAAFDIVPLQDQRIIQAIKDALDELSETTSQALAAQAAALETETDRAQEAEAALSGAVDSALELVQTKVSIEDIVDDLTTGGSAKVLSAEQGKVEAASRAAADAALGTRIDGLETLGHYVGAFDNYATPVETGNTTVPANKSSFPNGVTINDFVTVRADETHEEAVTRYVAEAIDEDTGAITWVFDFAVTAAGGEVDVSGKADKVAAAVAGHLATLDASGNLADSGIAAATIATKVNAVTDIVPGDGHIPIIVDSIHLEDSGASVFDIPSALTMSWKADRVNPRDLTYEDGGEIATLSNTGNLGPSGLVPADFVKITGNQTIDGTKAFSANPTVPTPTAAAHAANKGYVDSVIPAPTVVQLTIGSTAYYNPNLRQYAVKIGKLVIVYLQILAIQAQVIGTTLVTTLPAGYRPQYAFDFITAATANGTGLVTLSFSTNGDVTYLGSNSFATGQCRNLTIPFMTP